MKRLIQIGLLSCAVMLTACGGSDNSADKQQAEQQTTKKDFGQTPKQINDGVQGLIGGALGKDVNYEIKPVEDFFTVDLSPNVNWTGSIEPNGNVSELKYSVLTKSAEKADMLMFTLHVGALARTLSPELPKEQSAGEVAKMLSGMVKDVEQAKDLQKTEKIIGNAKYESALDPKTGIWATSITPVK